MDGRPERELGGERDFGIASPRITSFLFEFEVRYQQKQKSVRSSCYERFVLVSDFASI